MRLVLASGSPRRAAILHGLGLDFEVVPGTVDETRRPDESPSAYVERLAREKAEGGAAPDRLVIGCDTVVVHEGRVLGKPGHRADDRLGESMGARCGLAGIGHRET